MKRTIKVILVLLVLGAIGYGMWLWQRKSEAGVAYRTVKVERGDLVKQISATGTLNPLVSVLVGSQVSGIIKEIYVDFNSEVKEGQLLAQLDPTLFEAAVKQAEGENLVARANLAKAELAWKRAQELVDKKIAPQSDADNAKAEYDAALGSLKRSEGSLQRARADLSHTKIYSPVDGIVISRDVDVGQTVAASLSAPTLFVIAKDLTQMQINVSVDEADIGQVQEGQPATFTVDAYPTETFQGKVVQIRNRPLTVQNVVTYDVIVSVNNAELKLKPGMTANVFVEVASASDVLKLPNAALRFRPVGLHGGGTEQRTRTRSKGRRAGSMVWVLNSNNAPEPAPVELGLNDGQFTQVIDGLGEGQEVIIGYESALPTQGERQSPFGSPFGRWIRRM